MKDYQPKKSKYLMPQDAYNTTLWIIRGYYRFVDLIKYEADTRGAIRYDKDNIQSSNDVDITFKAAVKIADSREKVRAIDSALSDIPEEYRRGIWENILYHNRYPHDAAERTYKTYRARFIYSVAYNLDII